MLANREKPPVLGIIERRWHKSMRNPGIRLVERTLAIREEEPGGYDPYDNPGPVLGSSLASK